MSPIPQKLRREMAADPYYSMCARAGVRGHVCGGRITWEHALIYAGKQVQARFAIIPLCASAHSVDYYQDGGDLDKEVNEWIALNRATLQELLDISKCINYLRRKEVLNKKYGPYAEPTPRKTVDKPVEKVCNTWGERGEKWHALRTRPQLAPRLSTFEMPKLVSLFS